MTAFEPSGCDVVLVDAGVMSASTLADVSADDGGCGRRGGPGRPRGRRRPRPGGGGDGRAGRPRSSARLHAEGRLDGILGVGGSGGSSIAAAAMRALPVGVPKLLVSTMASGDTRPYVGTTDIAMLYSVVDIAGINGLSERILTNAAAGDRRHGPGCRRLHLDDRPAAASSGRRCTASRRPA